MFDSARFIKQSPYAARALLERLVNTQMFARFMESRTSLHPDDIEKTVHFDECIMAKRNRSKFTTTKLSTPFLDDRSQVGCGAPRHAVKWE